AYVIITDQTEPNFLTSLENLAAARHGQIIRCDDFRALPNDINARANLFRTLKAVKPRYVAIAPQLRSFSENVVLSFLQMLCNLVGTQIYVFPSFLVARDAPTLKRLIDQSLQSDTDNGDTAFSAATIAQSTGQKAGGERSIQKAAFVADLLKD